MKERFPMTLMQTRRQVLTTLSLAGAAALFRAPYALASEGALETPTVRLAKISQGGICAAPERVAGELLRAEGFGDVRYVPFGSGDVTQAVGDGTLDFALNFASSLTAAIDRGVAITVLSGIHAGCFGLFGHEVIRGIADLKGRRVAVASMGSPAHLFVAAMASQVGIDPGTDIHWITAPSPNSIELFIDGKADAFLGFPPPAARATGSADRAPRCR